MNAFLERLAEEGGKLVIEAILVGVLGLGAAILARKLARRGKVWVGKDAGRTCMSPFVLLLSLVCAAGALLFLALGLLYPKMWLEPGALKYWLLLVGCFSGGCLILLPFTRHTWEWDATGLRWHGAWRSVRCDGRRLRALASRGTASSSPPTDG